jgi:16S rRNA (adenine1518-N6/adenine1519-N6)-dimethyltransferase
VSEFRSQGSQQPRRPWRDLLAEIGVRPSKALGQNFLHDQGVVRRIVEIADIGDGDTVLEVGPGLGILTEALASRARRVIAVELDARLAEHLDASLSADNVRVVQADFLRVEPADLVGDEPYAMVANLPYSVAAAAIQHALEAEARPRHMTVMVQLEVAQRMIAHPPEMSVLSVAVQFHGTARIRMRIGPGAFVPAPKIDSAVVRIDVREQPLLPRGEWPRFFTLVRAGFSQRRKRLANALSNTLQSDKASVSEACLAAGVDPSRRAETLHVEEWLALHRQLRQALDA